MPLITEKTVLHLLTGIPLHKNAAHTLDFASVAAQTQFFLGHVFDTMTNCTYQRIVSRGYVLWDTYADAVDNLDYLMFNNGDFNGKWYYAFVDAVEYVNTETCRIHFTIDVMQTFMFDYSLKQCLIKRSHVGVQGTDNLWIAPETLDLGAEYETIASIGYDVITASNSYLLLTSTVDLTQDFGSFASPNLYGAQGTYVDELPSGCDYYVVGGEYGDNIDAVFTALSSFPWISKGIIGLTVLPKQMLNRENIATVQMGDGSTIIGKLNGNYPNSRTVASVGVFDPFVQREPDFVKFYGFPYGFIEVTCYNGTTLKVYPQYTRNGKLTVKCDTLITSAPEMKYYFSDYMNDLYDRSITLADFPQMPVQDSSYMLVRRRREEIAGQIGGALDTLGSYTSSGVRDAIQRVGAGKFGDGLKPAYDVNPVYIGNTVADWYNAIANVLHPQVDAPSLATQAGGTPFNYAHGHMGVTIKWKMITKPHRDIIRDFWTAYGYAVNRLYVPDTKSMSRYNFIQTGGCIIQGDIDAVYTGQIMDIYNTGITFWHDADIGNYAGNQPLRKAYGD